jgi:hypothetical protein
VAMVLVWPIAAELLWMWAQALRASPAMAVA